MKYEDLKGLIQLLTEKNISEFTMEREDSTIKIKRSAGGHLSGPVPLMLFPSAPLGAVSPLAELSGVSRTPPSTKLAATVGDKLHILKSSVVGIFRELKAPDHRSLGAGSAVEAGQKIGCIEILGLMHDVESDVAGEIIEKMVHDGRRVEYGQALFAVRPR